MIPDISGVGVEADAVMHGEYREEVVQGEQRLRGVSENGFGILADYLDEVAWLDLVDDLKGYEHAMRLDRSRDVDLLVLAAREPRAFPCDNAMAFVCNCVFTTFSIAQFGRVIETGVIKGILNGCAR